MTDLEPAPENILKFIRCNCKTTSNNPCGTRACSCKKNGPDCVTAYGNCYGQQCSNNEVIIYEEDSDSGCNDTNIFE